MRVRQQGVSRSHCGTTTAGARHCTSLIYSERRPNQYMQGFLVRAVGRARESDRAPSENLRSPSRPPAVRASRPRCIGGIWPVGILPSSPGRPMRSPAARCIRSDGCARAACLCSASLKVVDADPISACKGKSAARWVELGDPDPPPAENLRSPSRPRHVIFFPRCIFTPALLPGAYARSRLRHLSAVVVGLCSRCSLTACRCRGRPAAATSGAR